MDPEDNNFLYSELLLNFKQNNRAINHGQWNDMRDAQKKQIIPLFSDLILRGPRMSQS